MDQLHANLIFISLDDVLDDFICGSQKLYLAPLAINLSCIFFVIVAKIKFPWGGCIISIPVTSCNFLRSFWHELLAFFAKSIHKSPSR